MIKCPWSTSVFTTQGKSDGYFDDQLATLVDMRDEGLIGGVGLSNVSLAQLLRAVETTVIATMQNLFNLIDQSSRLVLDACCERGISFVPFFPLGSAFGGVNRVLTSPAVIEVAERLRVTAGQVAMAWTLAQAPNVLLIPGTSSLAHLEENMAAGTVDFDDSAMRTL